MHGEQAWEDVAAVDMDGTLPCEMVQSHMVEPYGGRVGAEQLREVPLIANSVVAQPHDRVAVIQERAGHDADRVREVDDPRAGRAFPCAPGDVDGDGDGTQRLREPARSGRFLPDASAFERDGLIADPGGLPADAELEYHDVRSVKAPVQV